MIGIIVSGHGLFAQGMESAMTLIGGKPEKFFAIDFLEGETTELLEDRFKEALAALSDCNGVIMCTDLAGGSPFKSACIVSQGMDNVHVLAGTNLPMLIELNLSRQFADDVKQLADNTVTTGKDQVLRYEYHIKQTESSEDEEGI